MPRRQTKVDNLKRDDDTVQTKGVKSPISQQIFVRQSGSDIGPNLRTDSAKRFGHPPFTVLSLQNSILRCSTLCNNLSFTKKIFSIILDFPPDFMEIQ